MKLDKAIEILTSIRHPDAYLFDPDEHDAIKLGIEALKRHKEMSALVPAMPYPLLPGETPEIDTKRSLHHIKTILESPIGREPKD